MKNRTAEEIRKEIERIEKAVSDIEWKISTMLDNLRTIKVACGRIIWSVESEQ